MVEYRGMCVRTVERGEIASFEKEDIGTRSTDKFERAYGKFRAPVRRWADPKWIANQDRG
jgi:hypothetical protein